MLEHPEYLSRSGDEDRERLQSCSKMKKNVMAISTGTISIRRTVFLALRPALVRAAKDSAPNSPDPPVPDDHVDTTFLKPNNFLKKNHGGINLHILVISGRVLEKGDFPQASTKCCTHNTQECLPLSCAI